MTLGALISVRYVAEEILVWGPNALYDLFNKHEHHEYRLWSAPVSYGRYIHQRGPCVCWEMQVNGPIFPVMRAWLEMSLLLEPSPGQGHFTLPTVGPGSVL